ncbi:MAG: hypothetical protein CMM76_13815 [Rhodospirillaceae bacterium]|nr:hypothetical protein [Rhodospirillaceae bacterium]
MDDSVALCPAPCVEDLIALTRAKDTGLGLVNLHPQLRQDIIEILTLKLSRVLLLNDSRFPWLVLVPDRPDVTELYALESAAKKVLMSELTVCSRVLEGLHRPDKINMGALGNLVPQLHIHVIARFETDAAWPGPIWGFRGRRPYCTSALEDTVTSLGRLLTKGKCKRPKRTPFRANLAELCLYRRIRPFNI